MTGINYNNKRIFKKNNSVIYTQGIGLSLVLYFVIYGGYIKVLFPYIKNIIEVAQMIAASTIIFLTIKYNSCIRLYKQSFIPFLCLCGSFFIIGLGYIHSNNFINAKNKIVSMIITLLFFLIILIFSDLFNSEIIIKHFMYCIIILNTFFVFVYFVINITNIKRIIEAGNRWNNINSNPIWISRMCCDTVILLFICGNILKKRIMYASIVFLLIISLLMGSKGPIIALFVSILVYLKQEGELNKGVVLLVSIIIASMVLVYVLNISTDFFNNRFSIASILVSDPGYRISRYIFTIKNIPKGILLGHGLGSWAQDYWHSVRYIPSWVSVEMIQGDYPHNFIIEVLYDNGIIGLVGLGLFYYKLNCIKYELFSNYLLQAFWIMFLINFLYSMFSGSVTEGNRGMYYFAALVCGLYNNVNKKVII